MNPTRIVLIGSGFGGTYVLKKLHTLLRHDPTVEITVITPENYFLFTPLLHEVATGSINPTNIVEPLRKILGCCVSTFFLDTAIEINPKEHWVKTSLGSVVSYDYVVIGSGSETNFFDTPGAAEHCYTLKTLPDAIRLKNNFISKLEEASHLSSTKEIEKKLRFVIVGGGPTGVELAAEMAELFYETSRHYYSPKLLEHLEINLVQRGKELLPQFPLPLREKSLTTLRHKKINVRLNTAITAVNGEEVCLGNGETLATHSVIWVAGVKPTLISGLEGVAQDQNNKLYVTNSLQLEQYPEIFVLGDRAAKKEVDGTFLPGLAQVAVQEAETVAHNIYALLHQKPVRSFFYRSRGTLVSLGQWMAIGEIGSMTLWGHLAWWLWRTIYLSKLISPSKKIRVAVDWTINLFAPRDISKI